MRNAAIETLLEQHWHYLAAHEVSELLGSHPEIGLSTVEVTERQQRFGPNEIATRPPRSAWVRFLLQFHQPLIYILLAATAITAVLQEWVDAGVIFGVVLVNAIVGFLQEAKAENAIAALARVVTTEATVIRDRKKHRIASRELVPGDLVLLASGDKVPADIRLLKVRDLQVDESALTGESVPVTKATKSVAPETALTDRSNMAYAGSLVTYGQGTGIVVAIGDVTETGRISQLVAQAVELSTPLLILGAGVMIGLQLIFTYSEVMNRLFQSAPIGFDAWLRIVAVGMGVYLIVGLEKWLRRTRAGKGEVAHQIHYPVSNAS